MKDLPATNYEQGRIAVDPVIFTIKAGKLMVYLNTREKEPFMGLSELPGGLLLPQETAEETLSRKLKDVIGTGDVFFEQFHTFSQPKRDPRQRTVSISFIALIPEEKVVNVGNFHDVDKLLNLAFDHKEIIKQARDYLRQNLDHQFAKQFLPEYFTLNHLQLVHEVIRQEQIDNRNFRKKILDSGVVEKAEKIQQNVSHRPAALYKYVGLK